MTNTTGAFQEWADDIEKARANLGIQGMSVAVVHKGRIIYAQGFGKRNGTDPFTPEVQYEYRKIESLAHKKYVRTASTQSYLYIWD